MAAPRTDQAACTAPYNSRAGSLVYNARRVGQKDILRLLWIVQSWICVSARNSLVDDLLSPYPLLSKHGPSRSHREVRDCLPVAHGNTTYEVWPSHNRSMLPVASTKTYASNFRVGNQTKTVLGHFTFINNPLRTVSVLEPGGEGGCSKNVTETVKETVKLTKCIVAQNGGFFNTDTGRCLGNIVSNGKLIQDSGGIQNAQFGIRADGTMVFGYLSEEQVLDEKNPFVQLLSGVVWLLRNGEIYVEESKVAECDKTQNTGSFDYFVDVVSARTAVGHDKDGRLVLFHVDGQTNARGLSLHEVATFLKEQGVINAINLDGGGSATLVINGTIANYPSDHCSDIPISSALSVVSVMHKYDMLAGYCGGHGHCVTGECQCTGFWTGPSCSILNCGLSNCSAHGNCTEGGCICDAGWTGSDCNNVSADHGFESVTNTTQKEVFPPAAEFVFTENAFAILSCILAAVLVVSVGFNIKQASWCKERCTEWKERRTEWKYSYQQLNGDMDTVEIYEPWDLKEKEYDVETHSSETGS
ncbi:N-acetylglucosamine-1-phosphodiester alpha-N-acetylglucosaminidase [Pelobates cultripes]|uniref:N-acetylglucosamine-1-phosphodiester alpha-N-acetylglucosaminidase n=1 Tax=Pelobates cultripes TaxID=61616 RepID=A0AAD1VJW6_PELCU|nr:N-acetylglucosamine-1-phosphodiester alpha-N-acetylglucosaminidase [Pelobates cultripes]